MLIGIIYPAYTYIPTGVSHDQRQLGEQGTPVTCHHITDTSSQNAHMHAGLQRGGWDRNREESWLFTLRHKKE